MSTAAKIGKGTVLSTSTTQGGSYTPVSEVTDVNTPSASVAKVDATHYTSPNDTMEYLSAVWRDLSDVTVELSYISSQVSTLDGYVGQSRWWKVILPDGVSYTFPGFLSEPGLKIPNKDKISQTMKLNIMGPYTIAGAS
jgi:hypothetical protein